MERSVDVFFYGLFMEESALREKESGLPMRGGPASTDFRCGSEPGQP